MQLTNLAVNRTGYNIAKAFGVDVDIEKAHQVGDVHPNGKWVWTQLPSGKYDWRTIKKNKEDKAKKEEPKDKPKEKEEPKKSEPKKEEPKKKEDKVSIPTTVEEAKKLGVIKNKDSNEAQASRVDLAYAKYDLDEAKYTLDNSEYKLKHSLDSGDIDLIKNYADWYATAKFYYDTFKKKISERKKERSEFLEKTGNDFTLDEAKKYLHKYNTAREPAAKVINTWHTLMGRIGNTSATITIGGGKEKKLSSDSVPSWRPLGIVSYSTMGWDGKWVKIEYVVQSWDKIIKEMSDTESMTINIYKHPKQ